LYSKTLKDIKHLINEDPKKIIITSHKNPDGDAVGSSLGLYGFLKSLGHNVEIIVPNRFPGFLEWIPNSNLINIYQNDLTKCDELISKADIIFSLDYNAFHRTGIMNDVLLNAKAIKILIDHHLSPTQDFNLLYSNTNVSSTCELVYNLIESFDLVTISKEIATALFVGIMTDTGSFSFSCNNPRTFIIVSKLIEHGIDIKEINQHVYHTNSENRTRLLGFCLSERLKVLKQEKTAYIYLSKEDLTKYNYQIGDTEGIVNYALAIQGVQLAALFSEKDGLIRISFRSKSTFDVNEFARKHFDGGGHKNAAGGNSKLSLIETLEKFESILK